MWELVCCFLYYFIRSFFMIFGIADLTRPQLPKCTKVTITWYRLSRLTVYSSHTLSTFLTSLNQELWSIVLWIVDIFDIIKSRTMV